MTIAREKKKKVIKCIPANEQHIDMPVFTPKSDISGTGTNNSDSERLGLSSNFFFFFLTHGLWKFPDQGSNPHHSRDKALDPNPLSHQGTPGLSSHFTLFRFRPAEVSIPSQRHGDTLRISTPSPHDTTSQREADGTSLCYAPSLGQEQSHQSPHRTDCKLVETT